MEITRKVRNYLLPDDFEIHIVNKMIHLVSFTTIGEISSEKILVRHKEGSVVIKGNNLTLSKLMHDEVLIKGTITGVEFR